MKRLIVIFLIALSTRELSSRQIFENITNKAGITGLGLTNSVSFTDYNNDGKPDLYIVHQTGSELYKNNGDQTFISVTNITSLPPGKSLLVGIMGDYDNDGDLDIFAGGEAEGYKCYLFRNDGDDQFTDISNIAGIGAMAARVFAATWLDLDNDGLLDLFLGTIPPTSSNIFFKNLGNATFANFTRETNLASFSSTTRGVTAGDYDRDGDLDIFVSNTEFNRNYFFRNDGNLFSEVASALGVEFRSDKTHSAEFADYDNDGDLDLLIGNNDGAGPYRLLRNDGGIFKDRTLAAGLNPTTVHFRGSAFGDFDNDGFLDLIVATNTIGRKIALYHNNGSGTFTDITATAGLDTLIPTLTLAVADLDNDGKLDIYFGSGVNTVKDQIYRNISIARNWLKLRLIGTASNKSGIGAWLQLSANSRNQYRQVVAGKGYKSQDDLTQHFGVGEATIIDSLKIEWPSGHVQILRNISANQFLTITEPNTLPPLRNLSEVSYSKIVNRDYAVQVSINVPNPSSIKTLTLYYRISGAPSFSKIPMSLQNSNTFTETIPATVITNRGAEFYVQAEDQYGNFVQSKRYPIRIYCPNGISNPAVQPYGKNASAYRLFSCPLDLDDKSPGIFLKINSSLGVYDKTQFRWYSVERTTQTLKEYPEFGNITLTPDMGFALLTTIRNIKLKTGSGTTVVTTTPYNITLPKGWSLIGNPFNYDIPFDSLSVSAGWFELWSFDGDWQINTRGLEPWKGYAVWLSQAATFSIRPGLAGLNTGTAFYTTENNAAENWLIQIIANNGGSTQADGASRFNFAGQHALATDEDDSLDLHSPLRLDEGVEVAFNHANLKADIRKPSANGHKWDFVCRLNPEDEVLSLTFDGVTTVPPTFDVFLLEPETATAYNLRTNPRLQFATRQLTEKRFQLVAGTTAYLQEQALPAELHPTSFALLQNFPNPFNPSTQIIYSLPEASHVEVSVYNLRGERVATLVNEQQASGSHTVVWNAERVGSGVYFIKMRAGRVERIRKCVLVK